MPTLPILPFAIGNNGGFRAVRSSRAQGSCGVHGYPCYHPGVDVVGRAGTAVRAPENGTVFVVADGSAPPFVGYGPYLVMIRGDSGVFHLLSHLSPANASMAKMGARVAEGQVIGTTSAANHTHWEVRKQPVPGSGRTNLDNNLDPMAWASERGTSIVLIAMLAGGSLWIWNRYRKGSR